MKTKKRIDMEVAHENIASRAKISSSVEDIGLIDRMKKRKDKGKDTRPKGKDKEGDSKDRSKDGKESTDDYLKKRQPARPACNICHIPYHSPPPPRRRDIFYTYSFFVCYLYFITYRYV